MPLSIVRVECRLWKHTSCPHPIVFVCFSPGGVRGVVSCQVPDVSVVLEFPWLTADISIFGHCLILLVWYRCRPVRSDLCVIWHIHTVCFIGDVRGAAWGGPGRQVSMVCTTTGTKRKENWRMDQSKHFPKMYLYSFVDIQCLQKVFIPLDFFHILLQPEFQIYEMCFFSSHISTHNTT